MQSLGSWAASPELDRYRRVARAVVAQAVWDVLKPRHVSSEAERVLVREDALRFIRKAVEEDGYERWLFEVAGVCPRRLLKKLRERLSRQEGAKLRPVG
ncbi:hypothetical protein [Ammonifex thiophilus]|uniref:Uncharacterized protein n=1 Tax=Ammonifex thiophilus TaxID=444093 RepID=A0A3D8P414_9THEO|nr:hypothetical protein [Ammonifex thiophilus]RDV83892.1 hypothetical protein DXX99_03395 [Ammonifex thiophilus]